jgi:hypothetical protein
MAGCGTVLTTNGCFFPIFVLFKGGSLSRHFGRSRDFAQTA